MVLTRSGWQFVDPHGQALHTSATYLDSYRIEFVAPPMVLNETDVSINTTMYISFSWQTWSKVQLNGNITVPIVYYGLPHLTMHERA